MTGIMEQVLAELTEIKLALRSISETDTANVAEAAKVPAEDTAKVDPLAGSKAQEPLTEDSLMALIEPHLENMTIKTALQSELHAMGIERLPLAQPHQYAELYQRFQKVIQSHSPHSLSSGGNQSII